MKSLRTYSLLAGSMLTFALASCSNDELTSPSYDGPVAAQVTAGINGVLTRAVDASWDKNDAIGISCNSQNQNTKYDNMKYVTTDGDGTFTHAAGVASGIFFQGKEEVTFSAYYPFRGMDGNAAGTIDNVTTEDQTRQKSFDYLYATGATTTYASPTISFTGDAIFKHKMSRLILKITTSTADGFNADDVTKGTYSISGIILSGKFDTTNGTAEATGDADDWEITATPQDAGNQRTYSMILYPQGTPTLTFKVEINGQTYATDITPTLTESTSNTYTITVKKTGLVVSNNTIEGWGSEQTGNSDAIIQ